jgi:alanine-glyoxylate transaminase / serine-glyoxylate transaminase / serine-pyruvate transaminase
MKEATMGYEPLPQRVLMGPGPSNVSARVLQALAAPTLGHLDPAFTALMDDLMERLRGLFRTQNALTFPVSGTGSAGMETCFVNVLQPGDRVLVGVNGVFGERMCDVARRCGAEVTRVEAEWGRALDGEAVRRAAREVRPKLLAFVHAETSTGVLQPVAEIAAAAREAEALLLMDCVTSLGGGADVRIDDWGVDLAYSGTQKCLSCPPGLAPVTFGERALAALDGRTAPVQSWYLDVSMIRRYWTGERLYHHTAPTNMLVGLREALRLIDEEGLEARIARHRRHAEALWAGLEAMGLRLFVPLAERLPPLTTVWIPEGAEDTTIRTALLKEANLEIGGGLGAVKGKVWRIGLMGETSTPANVLNLLSWLELLLRRGAAKVGSGLEAAHRVLGA